MSLVDRDLVATALGQLEAEAVVSGGTLVNVSTAETYPANVAIRGGRIAAVGDVERCIGPTTRRIDATGRYLVPGLIDPHLHPESTKLTLNRLAAALVPRGTTTIFAALDETWAVTGAEGVRFALEQSRKTPLRVIYHPYAHVPITGIEPSSTPAYRFEAKDLRTVLEWPDTVGTMDTVIDWVLGLDDDVLEKMDAVQSRGLLVHGHDPLETGGRLQAFLATGIRSDHVPHSAAEALEKLRAGMWVMFCDGPISHVLPEAIKAITETGISSRHATFCIDDLESRDALEDGHIDHQVRTAIASGLDPVEAIQMATLNAAECHRMDHVIGSIAAGRFADILLVRDLEAFSVEHVIVAGQMVTRDGELAVPVETPAFPAIFRDTFHLKHSVSPDDLVLRVPDEGIDKVRALVLRIDIDTPMRHRTEAVLDVVDGVIRSDPASDVLYCATAERHHATGNIGLGFVRGFNLNGGTLASSLGSPTCNITCIGSNPEDMAFAINHVAEIGGGQVLVRDGRVVAELGLPLGGFMADIDHHEMAERERFLDDVVHGWGCPIERPFVFVMMMEIVPLPHYALTEHGVVDFHALRYVDPILERIPASHAVIAGGASETMIER